MALVTIDAYRRRAKRCRLHVAHYQVDESLVWSTTWLSSSTTMSSEQCSRRVPEQSPHRASRPGPHSPWIKRKTDYAAGDLERAACSGHVNELRCQGRWPSVGSRGRVGSSPGNIALGLTIRGPGSRACDGNLHCPKDGTKPCTVNGGTGTAHMPAFLVAASCGQRPLWVKTHRSDNGECTAALPPNSRRSCCSADRLTEPRVVPVHAVGEQCLAELAVSLNQPMLDLSYVGFRREVPPPPRFFQKAECRSIVTSSNLGVSCREVMR